MSRFNTHIRLYGSIKQVARQSGQLGPGFLEGFLYHM
jgi:hypothetical protein